MGIRLGETLTSPTIKRQKLTPPAMQPLFPESSATPMQSTSSASVQGKIAEVFAGDDRLVNNSKVSSNGTFTPVSSYDGTNESSDIAMEDASTTNVSSVSEDCPCGFFHGPGQGDHHDIKAVGFAEIPLMRGPE